jgi:hypothetical protein
MAHTDTKLITIDGVQFKVCPLCLDDLRRLREDEEKAKSGDQLADLLITAKAVFLSMCRADSAQVANFEDFCKMVDGSDLGPAVAIVWKLTREGVKDAPPGGLASP